jgi:hypothetical protein
MRVGRGSLAAAVSTFVAAFSHAVAGGPLPGAAGLALCLAFSTLVCVALAGKRMSRVRLAASVLVSQALFHGLFSSLTATAGPVPAAIPPVGGVVAHVHSPVLGFGAVVPHASHTDSVMLLAHLVAAAVTFLALRHGELAVAALLELARTVVVAIVPRMPDVPARSRSVRVAAVRLRTARPRLRRPALSVLRHRGPPSRAFA